MAMKKWTFNRHTTTKQNQQKKLLTIVNWDKDTIETSAFAVHHQLPILVLCNI